MAPMDDALPLPERNAGATLLASHLLAHAGWARALAMRLVRDEATADDLVQRAWLAALERAPQQAERAGAWLGRVMRNLAWKERRSTQRRDAREHAAAVAEAGGGASAGEPVDAPPAIVAELEAQRLVVDALLAVDEPYRETLMRRWYRDEKPAAIARAMTVPVKTVETRLARGLERLRAELAARRGTPRQWCLALLPLALPAKAAAAATAVAVATGAGGGTLGSFATGAFAMSGTIKLVGVTSAVVAVAATWWAWPARNAPLQHNATAESAGEAGSVASAGAPTANRQPADLDRTADSTPATSAPAALVVRFFDPAGALDTDFWGAMHFAYGETKSASVRSFSRDHAQLPVPIVAGEIFSGIHAPAGDASGICRRRNCDRSPRGARQRALRDRSGRRQAGRRAAPRLVPRQEAVFAPRRSARGVAPPPDNLRRGPAVALSRVRRARPL